MKQIPFLLVLVLLVSLHTTAQTYKIDTTEISYENKLRPCFIVKYDAPPKTVKKAWDNFFGKNYNVKIKGIGFLTNKDLITASDVSIAAISDKRMDLFARITEAGGDGSELKYFMSFGYDFFLGPKEYPAEFAGMKKILNDFSVSFLTDYYGDEASRITREMKALEKNIKKNDRQIKKNIKSARKKSSDVANAMDAKNTSLRMENDQTSQKINDLSKEIDVVKMKQAGVTRN